MKYYCALMIVLQLSFLSAQNSVRIHFRKLGKERCVDVFTGESFEYKKKHERKWIKQNILAVNDTVFISPAGECLWRDIKCLKIQSGNYVKSGFRKFFVRASILFVSIDTFNNIILSKVPIVNRKAVLVSAGFYTAYKLIQRFQYNKIRLRKNTVLIPITTDFRNLNKLP